MQAHGTIMNMTNSSINAQAHGTTIIYSEEEF